jgi:hypothetical protein
MPTLNLKNEKCYQIQCLYKFVTTNNFADLNLKKDVYKAGVMGLLAAYN